MLNHDWHRVGMESWIIVPAAPAYINRGIVMEVDRSKFAGLKESEIKDKYTEEEIMNDDPTAHALLFPPKKSSKIKLVESREKFASMKPKEWVVDGLFEKGTINMIYARPNAGKSTIAAGIGMSVACGVDWAGRKTSKGRVVFLVAEGMNGFLRRQKAWIKECGTEPDLGYVFVQEQTSIKIDSSDIEDFKIAFEEVGGVSMIVVDTRRGWMSGRENESDDMARFYSSLRLIAGDACVLVLHHESKDGGPRGSSAELGDVDSAARVENRKGMLKLKFTKMRDDDLPKDTHFRMSSVYLDEVDNNGNVVSVAFAKHTEAPVIQDDGLFDEPDEDMIAPKNPKISSMLSALNLANASGDYCTISKSGNRSASAVLKRHGFVDKNLQELIREAIHFRYVEYESMKDQHRNTIEKLVVTPEGNRYVKDSCASATA